MSVPEPTAQSTLSQIARGSAIHFTGRVFARLGGVAFLAILTRSLVPAAVGEYAYLSVLGLLAGTLIDFGHPTVTAREVAAGETRSSVVSGLYVKFALAGLVLVAGVLILGDSPSARSYLLLWVAVLLDAVRALALTRARCGRRWLTIAAADIVRYWGPCVVFLFLTAADGWPESPSGVSTGDAFLSVCLASLGAMVLACLAEFRHLRRWRWESTTSIAYFVRVGFVLFLINLAVGFNNKLDILMLNLLDTETGVAKYAAAYTMINGLLLLPRALTFVAFPDLARLGKRTVAERNAWLAALCRALVLTGTGVGVLLVIFSRPLLRVVYGPQYVDGANVLVIMAVALPYMFLSAVLWNILVSQHGQSRILRFMLISTGLNVLLNFVLVPPLSIAGAALATLIVEILVYYLANRAVKQLPLSMTGPFVHPAFVVGVALPLGVNLALRDTVGDVAAGVATLVAYGFSILAIRLLRVEDLGRTVRFLRGGS